MASWVLVQGEMPWQILAFGKVKEYSNMTTIRKSGLA